MLDQDEFLTYISKHVVLHWVIISGQSELEKWLF
jgi:hypothetical protein